MNKDLKLYTFKVDCTYGFLEGLFIATSKQISKIIGKQYYSYEELGKYSEFDFEIEIDMIKQLDVSEKTINELYELKGNTISGINPIIHIEEQQI